MASFERVSKWYGPQCVLRDVTFDVFPGEVVAVVGPNGTGKTTLLRLLIAALRPDHGDVRIDGETVPAALSRTRVAYFGGESTLPGSVTVGRWRSVFRQPTAADRDPRRLGVLSRGTRQMVALRTIFSLPALRLIALDEPWEGLDPDAARWLADAVRARRSSGAALLLSSHRLHDLAGLCDRYMFLTDGRVLSFDARALCGPDEQKVTADALLRVFDRVRGGLL